MMRRTLANMAAFYAEQLALDTKTGVRKRAEAGLFVTLAPYGYRNVRDAGGKRRIVAVDPIEAPKVRRIFQLYAYHGHTLDSLRDALEAEGVTFSTARARFTRSKLYEMLTDRSYIGEIDHLGQWMPGTQEPLVDRSTFDRVQVLLGRRTYRTHSMLYAGGVVRCGHCGRPITGEVKTKNSSTGPRHYTYYHCSAYNAPGHPRARVTEQDVDRQVLGAFDRIRIEEQEVRAWFLEVFRAKTEAAQASAREQRAMLTSALTRVRGQKDGLLNLRLAGEVDAETYGKKSTELRDREARASLELEAAGRDQSEHADVAIKAFELSQSLRERWITSEPEAKRQLLEIFFLNLTLDGVSVVAEMRKPFDYLAEGLVLADSAQDRI